MKCLRKDCTNQTAIGLYGVPKTYCSIECKNSELKRFTGNGIKKRGWNKTSLTK